MYKLLPTHILSVFKKKEIVYFGGGNDRKAVVHAPIQVTAKFYSSLSILSFNSNISNNLIMKYISISITVLYSFKVIIYKSEFITKYVKDKIDHK